MLVVVCFVVVYCVFDTCCVLVFWLTRCVVCVYCCGVLVHCCLLFRVDCWLLLGCCCFVVVLLLFCCCFVVVWCVVLFVVDCCL